MIVIDTHAHLVPQSFPPLPDGVPADEWPEMVPLADGTAQMLVAGKPFRIFEPNYWDVPGRIAHLDREGITLQVLSPLPELLGYWYQPATTVALAEHMHRTIADAVATAPDRLAGIGMLPLQDIALSIDVARKAKAMGLRGFMVASNINGVSLADARFYPLFAELEALDLSLVVHGYRPAGTERMLGSPMLAPIIGVPQDGMAAVASFIMTDILGRFPALKLCFVHGGGTFGAVLDRMDHVWHEFPAMQETVAMSPRDYVKRFWFDTVTFSVDYLTYLIRAYGADTMMAGTDGPTPIGQRGLTRFVIDACDNDTDAAEKILWRNATRFFDLDAVMAVHARPVAA